LIYTTETAKDFDGNDITVSGFRFTPNKEFCTCRLDVEYSDTYRRPDKWRAYLNDLLTEKDQETLREFIGYCLLPTTKAQKALFIIGQGGEGKGVMETVIKAMFGNAMCAGAVKDLDNGTKARFARVKLVNRLIMFDDDLELEALERTAFLKQLITATTPSEIEQKGKQSFEELLYSRVFAFGNGTISSLYDNSDGFWRRQLILSTKPKDPNRVDNPNIVDDLIKEKDQIFNWALVGLERLLKNNYQFTVSEQTKQNIENAKRESNNILAFLESGTVTIDGARNRRITSEELYNKYYNWCTENLETPRRANTFKKFMNDNAYKYGIEQSYHIPKPNGGHARGYIGIGEISPAVI
jgi:putative DNA primase/helicase